MTADSLQKQSQAPAGRLFQKGQSGNPAGHCPSPDPIADKDEA